MKEWEGYSFLAAFYRPPMQRWSLFWCLHCLAADITNGVVMKKAVVACSSKFEAHARKTVSLAFALCENRIKTDKGNATPELKAMSAAMLSLEKAIDAFIAAERLSR